MQAGGKGNIYCGIAKPTSGKELGTAEECVAANQVRYYGIVKIDKSILRDGKTKKKNMVHEQLKLRKLYDDAKILVNDYGKQNLIIEAETATKAEVRAAKNRIKKLVEQKDKLQARIKRQKKVVAEVMALEESEHKKTKSKRKKK